MLHALAQIADDPSTLLIACADHGGGGNTSNDHDSDHPLDRTIPLLMTGGGVVRQQLGAVTLARHPTDRPLGARFEPPADLEGRVFRKRSDVRGRRAAASAVA